MLVEKRPDTSNLVPAHILAEHLEAEEIERSVCELMDAHPGFGKLSPQALDARRRSVCSFVGYLSTAFTNWYTA
ncbi:hypothetical protein N7517_009383 [Penicillium concentricum]|uniref:Uncharacterized protein n=1 Tax=Penicillium concentricum TaxID=293559 RepID=A0A9W9UWQ2_9EURO|nr:uncharacterized protein N7517_009383 [Penicillium concentricum]KAJ5360192.1 hypothetical protein N7517_009383 [Penicillium concentricum]